MFTHASRYSFGLLLTVLSTFSVAFAAPIYSSLGVVSDNGNTTAAQAGDTLTFTLTLSPADDANGVGQITFDIGAATGLTTTTFSAGGSSTTHQVTYTVLAGQDGPVSVTGITFQNSLNEDITSLPGFPLTPSPNVTVDNTAPTFSSISAASDNADPTIAIGGDTITFTLNLGTADTWSAANRINFDIGSNSFQTGFFTSDSTPDATKTVDFVVPADEEGLISVTGVTFTDFAGNAMTGFSGPYTPTPSNVDVDSILPVLGEVTPVPNPTNDNTPDYTFSSTEVGTISYGGPCSSGTTAAVVGNNTITFNTLGDAIYSTCTVRVTDAHGNLSSILNVSTFEVDTSGPSVDSVTVTTSGNAPYAREAQTVTYTVTFSESATVSAINTASSATNITTLTTELDAVTSGTDTLVFTVVDGDNGNVVPSVDFDLTDTAGNTSNITSLGVITGGPAITDTIAPTLTPVSIASNNANTAYAKTNDTVTVSFTASETITNESGTIFGEAGVTTNTVGDDWTLSLLTDGDEAEGPTPFTIDFEDQAGNTGVQVTAVTDGSSVTFDRTNPTLVPASVTIISDNPYITDAPTYYARSGNLITLSFETVETIQTPTGTLMGRAATFNNPSGNQWTATVTGNGTDVEGTVAINIDIYDLAGNNSLNITGTMDGTSVLYDRTAPSVPTVTTDLSGAATANIKHFSDATFNWSGAADAGSGLNEYVARLENASVSINESQTLGSATTTFVPSSFTPDENFYNFYVNVRDKAGNESGESLQYQQRYGVRITGIVRDEESGQALENAYVAVIAGFGSTCDFGVEICNDTTDATGQYDILIFPGRAYKLDLMSEPNYYLEKVDITAGTTDLLQNAQLEGVKKNESQQSTQTVAILAGTERQTEILANSLSGEIEATNVGDKIQITSFGRITSVTSTNPDVVITNLGGNVYEVENAGNIRLKVDAFTKLKLAKSNFFSGDARIGVVFLSGHGSSGLTLPGMSRAQRQQILGRQMAYKESLELAKSQNEGSSGQIAFYKNHNGHKVFAGYTSGKLGVSTFKRFRTNQVAYRGTRSEPKGGLNQGYLAVKNVSGAQESFKASAPDNAVSAGRAGTKIDNNDTSATIRAIQKRKELRKNKVDKFARVENRKYAKSRLKPRWEGKVVRNRQSGSLRTVKNQLDRLKMVQSGRLSES